MSAPKPACRNAAPAGSSASGASRRWPGMFVTLNAEGNMIDEIAPRKNVFVRPPIANLDVLFIVASTTQPVPSTRILDELTAAAVYKDVQPVLVITKSDLAAADQLLAAYEKSGIPVILLHHATGEGLDALREWIQGRLCAFCGNSGWANRPFSTPWTRTCTARPATSARSWAAGAIPPARWRSLKAAAAALPTPPALPAWKRRSWPISPRRNCSTPSRSSRPISGSAGLPAAPTAARPAVRSAPPCRRGRSRPAAMKAIWPCMRKPASERSGSDDPSRTGRGRRGVSRTGGRLFGGAHRAGDGAVSAAGRFPCRL